MTDPRSDYQRNDSTNDTRRWRSVFGTSTEDDSTRRFGLSRRDVLQMGVALGISSGIAQVSEPVVAQDSPELSKWVQPLPIPDVVEPTGTLDGYPHYEIPITEFTQQLHPDLPETTLWGFDGSYPGPIIDVDQGEEIRCTFDNSALPTEHLLEVDDVIEGTDSAHYPDYDGPVPEVRTSTHLHGGVVAPESDGQSKAWTSPDGVEGPDFETYNQAFPNDQPRLTTTYHDHALAITRLNGYAGMVGLYQITGQDEGDLDLPEGEYDVPLVIQDKAFNADGSLFYPDSFQPEFGGDTIVVNGAVWPLFEVEPRRYRFRIINGANARSFNLGFTNETGSDVPWFWQISPGHAFLDEVVSIGPGADMDSLLLTPFERAEVVVDFSDFAGETLTLTNDAEFPYTGANSGSDLPEILQINVADTSTSDPSTAPWNLDLPAPHSFDQSSVRKTREMTLDMHEEDGMVVHTLNGYGFFDEEGMVHPELNTTEIWEFKNDTGHTHPIHLHLVHFEVIGRGPDGSEPPDSNERGLKDTVRVGPDETVRILTRFEAFTGHYPWHCHMLEHEDNKMMLPFMVGPENSIDVLVCSVTDGFRHAVIEAGNQVLQDMVSDLEAETGKTVNVDVVDDPEGDASAFPSTVAELEEYECVVFHNTTGDILDASQEGALETYVENGGGWVGIHAASDTEYEWDWYGELLGGDAWFQGHPPVQDAEIHVTDQVHPTTRHLPARWHVTDEWYDFQNNPRGDVHVLSTLDEDSYDGAAMDDGRVDHPITWCHEIGDGRAWYTGLGHTHETWEEDAFVEQIKEAILWTGVYEHGDATATVWDSYEQVELTTDLSGGSQEGPMSMTIAPDGRVFFVERGANIYVIDPDTFEVTTALEKEFWSSLEDGGLGITIDPDFEENGWLYLYYSPLEDELDPNDDMPYNQLSRFTIEGDQIDPDSEVEILRVHQQRESCCHSGGELQFGSSGDLYLSTGDNVNPFASDGYTPIDETSTDPNTADAQGTSGDTSDLRGSIIRITPEDDGSYSIPSDNLFTAEQGYGDEIDAGLVRPEIFAMGFRNPFRFDVDEETGWVYMGDFGPDAGSWDGDRGPIGIREYNQIREAGYYGWPFTRGPNHPYVDYDFATGQSDDPFDPAGPLNDSPNNDGLENLPPCEESTLYVPGGGNWDEYLDAPNDDVWDVPDQSPYPELTDGSPNGGLLIRLDDTPGTGLPQYFDGKWLLGEWNQGNFLLVSFDENGEVLDIEEFLPNLDLNSPHDMEIGPQGRLHYIEWGEGFDGDNPGIYRIDHTTEGGGIPEDDAVSTPYGLNTGGYPEDPQSDLPVVIDGTEFIAADDANVQGVIVYNLGGSEETGDPIANTDHDALYQTEFWGDGLSFDVSMDNGTYDVTLHFAEIWWESPGERVFDVSVQGETVLADFDVYDATGGDHVALTHTVEGVSVTDGTLSISTDTSVDNSKLSGIEIREDTYDGPVDYELEGHTSPGWVGVSPSSIEGETNPTLTLVPGEEYVVQWTNMDGAGHNFEIEDANGNVMVSSDVVFQEGYTQTVQFTATEEMAEYYCEPHASAMRGDVANAGDVPQSPYDRTDP